MKKLVFIISFIMILCFSILLSGVVKAYQKTMYVSINNNAQITTTPEYITSPASNTLIHQIGLYGTSASAANYIYVGLQRKIIFNIYQNLTYTVYATTGYNQSRVYNLGSQYNGTFRFLFDTKSYPYQGIYYGNILHTAS